MSAILVSYEQSAHHRAIFSKFLSGEGNLTFLSDIAPEDRRKILEGTEVILSWSPSKEFAPEEFAQLRNLKMMQFVTAGADHVPFGLIPGHAIVASNPGAYAEAMAEHILAMALSVAKRLKLNHEKMKEGVFDQRTRNKLMRGMSFGVIGFGGIGKAAARLMRALGLKVLAINTSGKTSEPVEFVGTLDDLDHVLKQSDFLLLSIPLTVRSRGLIGERELGLMKRDAVLINAARGAIVEERALYEHLVKFPEFSAAIDTWWIEPQSHGEFRTNFAFLDLPNVLGSPHNSPIAPGVAKNAIRMACENVVRFLKGEKVFGELNREDYPAR
ncbi:MAG: 2-hydroxyacid dehydrogenase [Desulfobacteraceae bacterium]|nr:2-hydroxyacid dehydrogenase [Desulfobacteraceae bacterium]